MNRKVRMPPEVEVAIASLFNNLTYTEIQKLLQKKAKLIVIDGEAWFIDLTMED